jgi:ArsR family transcriptional regulator
MRPIPQSRHRSEDGLTNGTVRFLESLADPTRLYILDFLGSQGELCVCELVAALGSTQPKVSRHLAWLRRAGLVADRRRGTWIYYRLAPSLSPRQRRILRILAQEPENLLFRKTAQARLQAFLGAGLKNAPGSHPCDGRRPS